MTGVRRPLAWASLALVSGAALTILSTAQCALPPSEDCTTKATCAVSADATAPTVETGGDPGSDGMDPSVGDSGTDAVPSDGAPTMANPVPCGAGYTCLPPVPSGWHGPFAEWQGGADMATQPCSTGFLPNFVSYGNLTAPAASCSCVCAPTGQSCVASATIYGDTNCSTACASSVPVGSACSTVTGCPGQQGAMRADTPAIAGGSCVPTITKDAAAPAWTLKYLLCAPQAPDENYVCPVSGQVCAPIPPLPFSSRLCIAQTVPSGDTTPTSCPTPYPSGPSLSYLEGGYVDTRSCGPCSCATEAPVGGSCAGTIALTGANVDNCDTTTPYTIGSGCAGFNVSGAVARIAGNYTVTSGKCDVATQTMPTGDAGTSGLTQVICCM